MGGVLRSAEDGAGALVPLLPCVPWWGGGHTLLPKDWFPLAGPGHSSLAGASGQMAEMALLLNMLSRLVITFLLYSSVN